MHKNLPVKKYLVVVMESHTKIMKVVSLANNLLAKMEAWCAHHVMNTRQLVLPQVISYNEYQYITEKEYKDVLTELTSDGTYDFSTGGMVGNILTDDVSDAIKICSAKYTKTIRMPILLESLPCDDEDLQLEYQKLYKHYDYILSVILADILESGIRMNRFQMAQLNTINKVIKKKTTFGATQKFYYKFY